MIAVFTKFDQFKRNIEIKLEDEGRDPETDLNNEVESIFREHYQAGLGETSLFVRLESEFSSYQPTCIVLICVPPGMQMPGQKCTALIETTGNALSRDAVSLMLLAVQKDNLELSIKEAVKQ